MIQKLPDLLLNFLSLFIAQIPRQEELVQIKPIASVIKWHIIATTGPNIVVYIADAAPEAIEVVFQVRV